VCSGCIRKPFLNGSFTGYAVKILDSARAPHVADIWFDRPRNSLDCKKLLRLLTRLPEHNSARLCGFLQGRHISKQDRKTTHLERYADALGDVETCAALCHCRSQDAWDL